MRLLLIDDHTMFRQSFSALMRELSHDTEVVQAANAQEALAALQGGQFDIVLLDWWFGAKSGSQTLEGILAAVPRSRVVILSGDANPRIVDEAICKGACGFISKDANTEQLTEALRIVLRGGIYLPPASVLVGSAPRGPVPRMPERTTAQAFPELTPRQADVLRVALRGLSNKEIARVLGIGVATVCTHLIGIYATIGAKNRTAAVYLASQRGVLITEDGEEQVRHDGHLSANQARRPGHRASPA
jgi:DNA-binding NarL/FixJ family response regulator